MTLLVDLCNAAEAILLGFQHFLVMLGTTVIIPTALVPQMGGGNVRIDQFTEEILVFCIYLYSVCELLNCSIVSKIAIITSG